MALTDDLMAYWRLDEASGNRADAHGSSTLTDHNSVTQESGVVGSAAGFNGSNQWLDCPDSAALSLAGGTSVTIAAWVYLSSKSASGTVLSKGEGALASQIAYALGFAAGADRLRFSIPLNMFSAGSVDAATFGSPPLDTWLFVVGWYDHAAGKVFISVNDGTPDESVVETGSYDDNKPLQIGRTFGSLSSFAYWHGRIGPVGLWRRALTAEEITTLHNGGAGRDYPFSN